MRRSKTSDGHFKTKTFRENILRLTTHSKQQAENQDEQHWKFLVLSQSQARQRTFNTPNTSSSPSKTPTSR